MIDLHQGFSGEELRDLAPSPYAIAMVQLDATAALLSGRIRRAIGLELTAVRLLFSALRGAY